MKSIDIKYVNQFSGYKNNKDITALLPTDITAGSQNVFVEEKAKLKVRGGTRFLGEQGQGIPETFDAYWTVPNRIHSKYDTFSNSRGQIVPLRVFYQGGSVANDVFEVYLPEYSNTAQETGNKKWYNAFQFETGSTKITSNHRWYFAEWWDNKNLKPVLVFTGGTNKIFSWTGAYGIVTATTGTTITIDRTYSEAGFLNATNGGTNNITVNGTIYSTSGDFSTDTVTVADTTGINIGDIVFHNVTVTTFSAGEYQFDVCSMINNQVYYIDWRQRNVFYSWNRNQDASLGITTYTGTSGLDDALFSGTYTGSTVDTYQVTIDKVEPRIVDVSFSGSGANDYFIDASGFTGVAGQTYIYKFVVVGNASLSLTTTPAWTSGEVLVGQTSNAIAIARAVGTNVVGIQKVSGTFISGETIEGQSTLDTAVLSVFDDFSGYFSYSLDGTTVFTTSTMTPPNSQNEGLIWGWTTTGGRQIGDTWTVIIKKELPDTFSWTLNGETQDTKVPITGGNQTLSNGVRVNFEELTGHNQGDTWRMTAFPQVIKGYTKFDFSVPVPLPGEGGKLSLDTNGWTMSPQENSMYINGAGGEWYRVTKQLSADLLNESLQIERLKTEPKNKVLYPYLIGYMKNYLSIVSLDRTFDILGRQEFLELPQAKSLSDEIKLDFITGNWENGNIIYEDRKMFFCLPEENKVLVYDDLEKYWHAPMTFARKVSMISFIDNKICGHSYERNETYELFTNALNDLGEFPIKTDIVFGYNDMSSDDKARRFQLKSLSAIALDGYSEDESVIDWKINCGVGGCDGIRTGQINLNNRIVCLPPDTASLGKSSLGFHGLGNSPSNIIPHFKYGKTFEQSNFYLRNIELSSRSLNQRWEITSVGTDVETETLSNGNMFNTDIIY